ncbi:hypothetical protein SAMN05444287_2154 [Octadecabacter temperatus]|uniref:Uncharacterized protein n=1 Tax=Octadecabacter temperatus TaxID=1458307 RepID=A0A0K0Y7T0_9RHOB|nr:hypothetical protein [Octadecabacter temperatus]AKS47029.1 hypothetical protein OSB_24940 [Octadecabacter temperatus]SIO25476.1 hypothetical protein SAMN05444287_2154 [Octadecabacter temperatus]
MTIFNILRPVAMAASLVCFATTSHAQTALETAENIAGVMEACVLVTTAHDYAAEGQRPDISWNSVTERSAYLGTEGAPVTVTANVWRTDMSYNSYCDFQLEDADLAQAAFDLFMTDRTPVVLEEQQGICYENAFLIVYATGPESVQASAVGAQGYISVHNQEQYGEDPCAAQ